MKEKDTATIVLLCIFSFIIAFFISNRFFRGDPAGWKQIISSDGRGYYAYLPALLIDHDLSYQKVVEREKRILGIPDYQPGYLVKAGKQVMNKYFAGEALLLLPFFALAMAVTSITSLEMDGYSLFFQVFTGMAALFYLFLGLLFLKRILQYFTVRLPVIAFVLAVILLGTNLLYYSVWQPSMSHVYSFFAINGFLWASIRIIRNFSKWNAVITGFFLGMVILVRPTNGLIIILFPFLFSDLKGLSRFLQTAWQEKTGFLCFLAALFLLLAIQPALWYLQTGRLFIWPYRDEGFYFGDPQIKSVLFSFRKGLFIYAPFIFLAVPGLLTLVKRPVRLISLIVFLGISTYVISSWWNWYYGDSFGLRAFIDFYGIYGLLIGLLFNQVTIKIRNLAMILLTGLFIFLNLFQTWQYDNHIIHPNSMNKARYFHVFLKSDSSYINCLGGPREMAGYAVDLLHPALGTLNTFEEPADNWYSSYIRRDPRARSGKHLNLLDSINIYSSGFFIQADKISAIPARYYVEGSISVYDSVAGASNRANLVFSMDSINFKENYWEGFRLNDIPVNPARTWRTCSFSFTMPKILNPGGILKVYIWNFGKKPFLIDDFQLVFYIDKSAGGIN